MKRSEKSNYATGDFITRTSFWLDGNVAKAILKMFLDNFILGLNKRLNFDMVWQGRTISRNPETTRLIFQNCMFEVEIKLEKYCPQTKRMFYIIQQGKLHFRKYFHPPTSVDWTTFVSFSRSLSEIFQLLSPRRKLHSIHCVCCTFCLVRSFITLA